MKTKEQKEFEKWAMPKLQKIQKILLLEHYQPLQLDVSDSENVSESLYHYPYQTISIRYSKNTLKDFKEKKYEDIMHMLIHEMCHPLTDPLYGTGFERFITKDQLEKERERLTDHIANIILKNNLL